MKHAPIPLIIALAFLVAACSDDNSSAPGTPAPQLTSQDLQVADAYNRFGFNLFREVAATQPADENMFISPMSVSYALGMTMNGAQSVTYDEMRTALQFNGLTEDEINASYKNLTAYLTASDAKVTLDIANSIWHREGFNILPDFLQKSGDYFDAQVRALDFNAPDAADIMNAWVKEKTNGRIADIVSAPIHPLVMMYLMNAIYFKGDWKYRFDPAVTAESAFHNRDGSVSSVSMMTMLCNLPNTETAQYAAVELPYGNGGFSMVIVLPNYPEDISSLISELDADAWAGIVAGLETSEIRFAMPKFTLSYESGLAPALKALGILEAFKETADFSRITGSPGLYITDVKHKTWIAVDEAGTEAAAVTSVELGTTSTGRQITVDRPFVYAIREAHSGSVVFLGCVNKL